MGTFSKGLSEITLLASPVMLSFPFLIRLIAYTAISDSNSSHAIVN